MSDDEAVRRGASRPGRRYTVSSRDIARAAGVSQSTVSRVINKSPRISEPTRLRVEATMQQLGYSPNAAARTLITGRSNLLGLVVSNITNPFYPEVIEAVVAVAAEHDYNVVLCNTRENPQLQLFYLRLLIEHQIDGAILTSTLLGSGDALRRMGLEQTPIVLVNRTLTGQRSDSVRLDNARAGVMATAHFVALGHRVIAFIGGRPDTSTNADRLAGYRRALREAGLTADATLITEGEFTRSCGYEAAGRVLRHSPRPTALVCADDLVALGAMDAIADAGLRVPEDVAVVGFDDVSVASLRAVSLSTIRQPAKDMGRRAVELLLERLDGDADRPPVDVVFHPQLVVRRTCGGSGA